MSHFNEVLNVPFHLKKKMLLQTQCTINITIILNVGRNKFSLTRFTIIVH